MKWIIFIIIAIIFIAGAIWYVINVKKALQEEQDEFYGIKDLSEIERKKIMITEKEVRKFSDAVVFGDFNKVKQMIADKPAVINSQDEYGFSALHNVMSEEQFEIVAYLIKNGANVNIQNDQGISPLHLAGYPKNVELLLNAGAEIDIIDFQGNTPLHIIASETDEYIDVVEYLISRNANRNLKNKAGQTPLNIAIEAGNEAMINVLK